jgi:anti-sigma B factor antagonist
MTLAEWLSLSETERETEKRHWQPFETGYWHTIAVEAAARSAAEFGSKRHVTRVFKSLYHARELIIAVQTDLAPPREVELPKSYLGIEVMQFANQLPEGVLVEPGLPGKSTSPAEVTSAERTIPQPQGSLEYPAAGSHRVLSLEGEIDLHVSPAIAGELSSLIRDKPEKLVLDLSNVSYIDSSGLAVLLDGMRKMEAYRGKLYLTGMQDSVRTIFETSRLDQAFRIRPDVAAALAAS